MKLTHRIADAIVAANPATVIGIGFLLGAVTGILIWAVAR